MWSGGEWMCREGEGCMQEDGGKGIFRELMVVEGCDGKGGDGKRCDGKGCDQKGEGDGKRGTNNIRE